MPATAMMPIMMGSTDPSEYPGCVKRKPQAPKATVGIPQQQNRLFAPSSLADQATANPAMICEAQIKVGWIVDHAHTSPRQTDKHNHVIKLSDR